MKNKVRALLFVVVFIAALYAQESHAAAPLGKLVKEYTARENSVNVVVEKREIGKSVAYIAKINSRADKMSAYTVQKPDETGKFQTLSAQVKKVSAVIAINGDYYNYKPREQLGVVVRNGVLYRNVPMGKDAMVVYKDGRTEVMPDDMLDAEELLPDILHIFSFGPALVSDGQKLKFDSSAVHPRTAIGQIDRDNWVFVVVDGRQEGYSAGMSYSQLADLFIALGCKTAYNLDGGGSSTMWLKDEGVINKPCENKERSIADILYF